MKRICLPLVICICLLLTACGSGSAIKSAYEDLSTELNECNNLSFTAEVRAEYENKTARFTLGYQEDSSGGTVTVLAPELISGVSAHVSQDGSSLEYDGVILGAGALDSYGLSPISSLPVMIDAIRNGHLDTFWSEDGKTVCQLIPNDELICTVWFNPEDMTPVHAELICSGRVTVYTDITDWEIS